MANKANISIGLGANVDGLKNDFKEAVNVVNSAGKQMGDSASSASSAITSATDRSRKSVSGLRSEYRAALKDVYAIGEAQGFASKAFLEAAAVAGEYKDKVNDANKIVDAFSADSKFTSVANAMKAAAGAASIVTGSMALLGVESEDVQKTMLKVQGAIALTSGIAQIKEMSIAFTALSAVIKTQVIPSLITLRGALMATGIVAIVAAVGMLAYNWYQTKKEQEEAAKSAEAYKEKLKEIEEQRQKTFATAIKTLELQNRAMADGSAKELAALQISKAKETEEVAKQFRNKLIEADIYNRQLMAIEEFYAQERAKIIKKYEVKDRKQVSVISIARPEGFKNLTDGFKNATIPIENFVNTAKFHLTGFEKFTQQLSTEIGGWANVITSAFVGVGQAIGQAMVSGADDGAKSIIKVLGGIAQLVGSALISMGVLMKASGLTIPQGIAAVAAGVGLVALGSAMQSGSVSGGSSGSGGGGGFSAPNYNSGGFNAPSFSGMDNMINVNGIVRGNNLMIVTERAVYERSRR